MRGWIHFSLPLLLLCSYPQWRGSLGGRFSTGFCQAWNKRNKGDALDVRVSEISVGFTDFHWVLHSSSFLPCWTFLSPPGGCGAEGLCLTCVSVSTGRTEALPCPVPGLAPCSPSQLLCLSGRLFLACSVRFLDFLAAGSCETAAVLQVPLPGWHSLPAPLGERERELRTDKKKRD